MLRRDTRGQVVQIGTILLFGLLILGLSMFQVYVVPQENKAVEFDGYVEATNDLSSVRNDLLAAGTTGAQTGTTVRSGTRYPPRALFVNPPPAVGSVLTRPDANVTIDGVVAVSGEADNTRAFWNTTARGPQEYHTRSLYFDPGYNELAVPPVAVTPVAAYRVTDQGPLPLTEQTLVSGNRITLVTVAGDVSAIGDSVTLTADPVSAATRTVAVTGSGGEFTVTFPVEGDAAAWNDSTLAAEIRANPYVVGTQVNGSRIDVRFDGTERYELRLARVVVRSRNAPTDVTTTPAYVVPVSGDGTRLSQGDTGPVVVEVRDRYNNPVSGVDVSFTATGGTFDATDTATATVTTADDGRVRVGVRLGPDEETVTVTASVAGADAPFDETTATLTSTPSDGTGFNPGGSDDLVLIEATIQSGSCGGGTDCQVDVSLRNFDDDAKNVTMLSLHFYGADDQGGGGGSSRTPPDTAVVDGVTLENGGDFEPLGRTVAGGTETTLQVTFSEGGSGFDVQQGDFFLLTARIDQTGNGVADTSATYFVGPTT